MMAVCVSTVGLYWLTLRYADARIPGLQRLVLAANESEARRDLTFVQQNLNAMPVKLGERRARLARPVALVVRRSSLAGFRPQEFRFPEAPGRGGAAPTLMPPQN